MGKKAEKKDKTLKDGSEDEARTADSFIRGAAAASTSSPRNSLQTNHYDSPKNSHIPSHYDMPPVRQYPPSPGAKRKAR